MAQQMGWEAVEHVWRKGPWTAEEDRLLIEYVKLYGDGRWNNVSRLAGLKRNGKSCRLRWVNYLRPDLKKGQITPHEERIILDLHSRWGNRWSTIARSLPGRTDNEIKNYWRTHFKKNGKTSSERLKKSQAQAQARLLKRQLFQFQQQQQQQQQEDHIDMKKIMSYFDKESDDRSPSFTQFGQEYPSTTDEQGFLSSLINGYANLADTSNEDMTISIWDDLWNLDDFRGNNRANFQHTNFY
ncbi:hypothetical protein RD792_009662 [Penstemon davidsonii]|uniref:Uncharacterized protein n=1 Tax=Penstemon davidsonii TaxID=160366 RepID=A0ABR0D138_9LAMI|nr:hypothetical protein RD792_009662 [Penstemon davidsonii]